MTDLITVSQTEAGGRRYLAGGDSFPSVSEVLSATAGRRWGLEQWRRNLGEEAAGEVAEIARQRGRLLHRQIHAYRQSGEVPEEPSVWWLSAWPTIQALPSISTVLLAEQPVIHPVDRYGGTPDEVSRMHGRARTLAIHDWKTSAEQRSPALLADYEDQLAGYADLVAWELGERPRLAVLVIAIPGRPAQVHRVDLEAALPRWRARLAEYHATR